MAVVRRFCMKKYSTTATTTAAVVSLPCSVPTEASMKLAWRIVTTGVPMPAGRPGCSSCSAASIRRVRATVSAAGCFCTPSTTAGWPLKPASPRRMAGAKTTSATCDSWIARCWPASPFQATGRRCRSSSRVVRPMLRIRYSRAFSSRKPPLVLAEKPCSAAETCSSVTPSAASRAVSGCTWYWRTSPPIGTTCATPGSVSSRGRITKSATSRTAIGLIFCGSIGRASSMISPITELTGPMPTCCTPGGNCSRTTASRSETSCRAR